VEELGRGEAVKERKYFQCPKCGRFVKVKPESRSGYGPDGYYFDIYYVCKKCGDGIDQD
jgi:phage terminase large subunit GpA-like protein